MGTRENPELVNHKWLLRVRGCFSHFDTTHDGMLPFCNGFHNTIDSWRDGRDREGWKRSEGAWEDALGHWLHEGRMNEDVFYQTMKDKGEEGESPSLVVPLESLFEDLEMFLVMMEEIIPTKVPSRFIRTTEVMHGFADASGRGLGIIKQKANDGSVRVRIGAWAAIEEEEDSSNFREFSNASETIASEGRSGR